MKKIALVTVLALLLTLCGCHFNFSTAGIEGAAASLPVSEMLQAASDNDYEAFSAHLHPDLTPDAAKNGFSMISGYLAGAKVTDVECCGINTTSSISTGGSNKTVTASYLASFDTGSLLVDVVYVKDDAGEGFTEFLCKIGIAP